jgi:hypothetical protein
MFNQISFCESPIVIIGFNEEKEKTFNNEVFTSLLGKKKQLESKFCPCINEKSEDLLCYNVFYPMHLSLKEDSKYRISKENLNKIFQESNEKRNHKEIYKSKLFQLINPYHLVKEMNYISEKYISKEIKAKFDEEKEDMLERECALSPTEYYDKKNQIYFGFQSKKNKSYKMRNNVLIKNAIKNCDILVRLKNENDCFDKNFLLRPSFKVRELKSLISFIYKTVMHAGDPGKISLFYYSEIFTEVYIVDEDKTLKELGREMKNKFVLDIFINAEY